MNLDYAKSDGLITAVIQDHASGRVLMVGFMNEEAFRKTVETGFATFYSRSRKKLWLKGESSGHRLAVKEISTDCDQGGRGSRRAVREGGLRGIAANADRIPVLRTGLPALEPGTASWTWVGHSTYLVRLGGVTILTDPVWSARIRLAAS